MRKLSLALLALSVATVSCRSATIDIAIACDDNTPADRFSSIELVIGLDPQRKSYCADKQFYWPNIKVDRAELFRWKDDGTIRVRVTVADNAKPILAHVSSEYIWKRMLIISEGKVIGAPMIAGTFDSKFELVEPDAETGKSIVRALRVP